MLPGTAPPQKPMSTNAFCAANSRSYSRAGTFTVAGTEFRGMSTMVVTPPAAAARVAVAKPSHAVRPGSLTWTRVTTSPGIRVSPSASSDTRAPVRPASSGSAAAIGVARAASTPSRCRPVTARCEFSWAASRRDSSLSGFDAACFTVARTRSFARSSSTSGSAVAPGRGVLSRADSGVFF